MTYRLEPLEALIQNLSRLPGIGGKTAARLALHIVRMDPVKALALARSIEAVKEKIGLCPVCFNLTDREPCAICSDPARNGGVICIVEGPGDVMAVGQAGGFSGRYHVLHGVLQPLEGVGPEELKIGALLARLAEGGVREVILATNPSVEGEATAAYIARAVSERMNDSVRVTRIAYGVPFGADIKYTDQLTLKKALEARRAM